MRRALAMLLASTMAAACDRPRPPPPDELRVEAKPTDSTAAIAPAPPTIASASSAEPAPIDSVVDRDAKLPRPHTLGAPPIAPAVAVSASASTAPAIAPALDAGVVTKVEPDPEPVRSVEVSADAFRLWAQSRGHYKVGETGHIEVVLVANGDYHVNPQYPYKLTLGAPPAGLTFPSAVVRSDAMSISEKRGVMTVPVVPTASGPQTIAGRFSLSVCTSATCHMETRDVAITIKVD